MNVEIDWPSRVIFVPRAELSLVQSVPTEIRELNLNAFRMALKNKEDDEAGMVFPDTHRHNTEVSLGGLTFARVIEIINNYTVTFEDGQYAVNLIGANSNVGDRVNVNQVSVRSQNSAGMTSSAAIEYGSFNGAVTIDAANLTGNAVSGAVWPAGSEMAPVDNVRDMLEINELHGFDRVRVRGHLDIDSDTAWDVRDLAFSGEHARLASVYLDESSMTQDCVFRNLSVEGTLDGNNVLEDCIIGDLYYVEGSLLRCKLSGTIVLGGSGTHIRECFSSTLSTNFMPTLDMGGSGRNCAVHNFSGHIKVANLTGANNYCVLSFSHGGMVHIDSSVSAGTVIVCGTGAAVVDNHTGTARVLTSYLMTPIELWAAVGTEVFLAPDGVAGTTFPRGTVGHPVNNLHDALEIARTCHLQKIVYCGRFDLEEDISDIELIARDVFLGQNSYATQAIQLNGHRLTRVAFTNAVLEGTMVGEDCQFNSCYLVNIDGLSGEAFDCRLDGMLRLGGYFSGVDLVAEGDETTVDFGLDPANTFSCDMASGYLLFKNMVRGNLLELNMRGGEIELEGSSCSGGDFYAEGYGTVFDTEGLLRRGVLNVKANHLLALETIPEPIDARLSATHGAREWGLDSARMAIVDSLPNSLETLELVRKLLRNRLELAEGTFNNWTLYDDDGVTIIERWHVSDKMGTAVTIPRGAVAKRRPANIHCLGGPDRLELEDTLTLIRDSHRVPCDETVATDVLACASNYVRGAPDEEISAGDAVGVRLYDGPAADDEIGTADAVDAVIE